MKIRGYHPPPTMNLALALFWMMHTVTPSDPADSEMSLRSAHTILLPIEREIERAREENLLEYSEAPSVQPAPPKARKSPKVEPAVLATDLGEATHYGGRFHGRRTASGEIFDQNAMTAAHRTYPFGTIVKVTNTDNGRSVVVTINDRGPFGPAKTAARKIIDVSRAAARELGFYRKGRTVVRVEVLAWGD